VDWKLGEKGIVDDSQELTPRERKERQPYLCPDCAAMWEYGNECPNCHFKHRRRGQRVTMEDGTLRELTEKHVKRETSEGQRLWSSLLGMAAAKRMTCGQVYAIYCKRTGAKPDSSFQPMFERHQSKVLVRDLYPGFWRRKKR